MSQKEGECKLIDLKFLSKCGICVSSSTDIVLKSRQDKTLEDHLSQSNYKHTFIRVLDFIFLVFGLVM